MLIFLVAMRCPFGRVANLTPECEIEISFEKWELNANFWHGGNLGPPMTRLVSPLLRSVSMWGG